MTCLVEDQHRIEGVGDVHQPDKVLLRLPDVLVHYVSQPVPIDLQQRVRWCTRQSYYYTGFAGLSEDGTGLPDTSPSLMFGDVHQNQQLHWIRVKHQVEYRGTYLFRTAHADLDSNMPVDGAINLTCTCVWPEGEDDVLVSAEPVPEGLTENVFGVVIVFPHGPERYPCECFPALDLTHQSLGKLASSLSEQDADTDRLRP